MSSNLSVWEQLLSINRLTFDQLFFAKYPPPYFGIGEQVVPPRLQTNCSFMQFPPIKYASCLLFFLLGRTCNPISPYYQKENNGGGVNTAYDFLPVRFEGSHLLQPIAYSTNTNKPIKYTIQ